MFYVVTRWLVSASPSYAVNALVVVAPDFAGVACITSAAVALFVAQCRLVGASVGVCWSLAPSAALSVASMPLIVCQIGRRIGRGYSVS